MWTEPVLLDAAYSEFEGVMDKYLDTAERLYGPYLWERSFLPALRPISLLYLIIAE